MTTSDSTTTTAAAMATTAYVWIWLPGAPLSRRCRQQLIQCDECLVAKAKSNLILIGFAQWDETGKQSRKQPLKLWAGPDQYRYHVGV